MMLLMAPPQTPTTREWAARVAAALPELTVVVAETPDDAARAAPDADAAFGTLPPELLRSAKRLRWLQAPQAAPPAGYYSPELVAHPVAVTNFREIYNDHIAAHIMAFVLAFARGLHVYVPQQVRREWRPLPLDTGVIHLPEAPALFGGGGGSGAAAARLCEAFGMHVIGVRRRPDAGPGPADEVHGAAALATVLPRADYVVLAPPLTAQTRGMFGKTEVAALKEGALLVNVGRGDLVDEPALLEGLGTGRFSAALDVFATEPLPPEHLAWDVPGLAVSPHCSSLTPTLFEGLADFVAEQVDRFVHGRPVRNVVDKGSGYPLPDEAALSGA